MTSLNKKAVKYANKASMASVKGDILKNNKYLEKSKEAKRRADEAEKRFKKYSSESNTPEALREIQKARRVVGKEYVDKLLKKEYFRSIASLSAETRYLTGIAGNLIAMLAGQPLYTEGYVYNRFKNG